MGYYVELVESTFEIPADKLDEALNRLKALNHDPNVEKRGGSWGPGGKTESWFSWMDSDYDQKVTSAAEVFTMLGFEVDQGEDGSIILAGYDNKSGQEDLFIDAVKDLAVTGWFMVWRGEDGYTWRHTADGIQRGKLVFE